MDYSFLCRRGNRFPFAVDCGSLDLKRQDRKPEELPPHRPDSCCGGLEIVPLIRVSNLVRSIETLKKAGFWIIGMDGTAEKTMAQDQLPTKAVFILGSEGDGMRRLTAENCDYMLKLPISNKMESLNVSNAAAITLYEFNR